MKICRNELVKALDFVSGGVDPNDRGKWASYLWLGSNGVYFYNGGFWAYAALDLGDLFRGPKKKVPPVMGVPGREFVDLVKQLPDEELDLSFKGACVVAGKESKDEIRIAGKRRKSGWTINVEAEFPLSELMGQCDGVVFRDVAEDFLEVLAAAMSVVSSHPTQYATDCVQVSREDVLATNDIVVFSSKMAKPLVGMKGKKPLFVPGAALRLMAKAKVAPTKFGMGNGWVYFSRLESDGVGVIGICTVEGEFPVGIGDFLGLSGEEVVIKDGFLDAVNRSGLCLGCLGDDFVGVSLKKDNAQIQTRGDVGWYQEDIPMKYAGPDLTFHISLKVLNLVMRLGHQIFVNREGFGGKGLLIFRSGANECITRLEVEAEAG